MLIRFSRHTAEAVNLPANPRHACDVCGASDCGASDTPQLRGLAGVALLEGLGVLPPAASSQAPTCQCRRPSAQPGPDPFPG